MARTELSAGQGPFRQSGPERRERSVDRMWDKLTWHNVAGRKLTAEDRRTAEVRGVPFTHYESSGRALLLPSAHAAAFEHTAGPYEGIVFGVRGAILQHYLESGGPESAFGLPTSDEIETPHFWRGEFEGGAIVFQKQPLTWEAQYDRKLTDPYTDILAHWSNTDMKRYGEPIMDPHPFLVSPFGTSAAYLEFVDNTTQEKKYTLVTHLSGKHKKGIATLKADVWNYYLEQGGPESRLGLPLPMQELESVGVTVYPFEQGQIIQDLKDGSFTHKVRFDDPWL